MGTPTNVFAPDGQVCFAIVSPSSVSFLTTSATTPDACRTPSSPPVPHPAGTENGTFALL
jgi:hypothetical protein